MSLNKKSNQSVFITAKHERLNKFQSRGRQLAHAKVEQCQLQIDDLICLMDGASAHSYLPLCQQCTALQSNSNLLLSDSAIIPFSPHETHFALAHSKSKPFTHS